MFLVLTLLACHPDDPGAKGPRPELTAELLRAHTESMTDIGPRPSGLPGEVEAEQEVLRRLGAAGLEPALEPFVWDAWRPGLATLTVGAETWEIEAHSPTPTSDITAPLALENQDLDGSIALFSTDTGSRAEHFLRAASNGALGFVRINDFLDFDGSPLVEVGHTLEGSTLPGAAVDAFVGAELSALAGQEARLRIEPDIAVDHTSHNVVARLGPADSETRLYITAHYDSWYNSECAFDNALGVGALLAMADRMAAGPAPEVEVVFIATSGEEQGLQGGFAWVEQNRERIGPGDLVVNLDVLWAGSGRFNCMATTDALRDEVMAAAEAEGLEPRDAGEPGVSSDHFPFILAGTDAIWCERWPDRHYHTVADTLDQIDLDEAAAAMRSQWAVVARFAGVEP